MRQRQRPLPRSIFGVYAVAMGAARRGAPQMPDTQRLCAMPRYGGVIAPARARRRAGAPR